jgi:biotin carboxyl carrier protein
MKAPPLPVRVDRPEGAERPVRAPAVGRWWDPPRPGTVVGPGSAVGRLHCLNRRWLLVMPDGAAGVVDRADAQAVTAVGFGDVLFRLRAMGDVPSGPGGAVALPGTGDAGQDLPPGTHAVRAPTDGVFYRKPAPDAPPFVEPGSRVSLGQPVGLVEVMKTFNQIVYGGPGLPEEGEVVEIRCEDGSEVSAGEVLVVVR